MVSLFVCRPMGMIVMFSCFFFLSVDFLSFLFAHVVVVVVGGGGVVLFLLSLLLLLSLSFLRVPDGLFVCGFGPQSWLDMHC